MKIFNISLDDQSPHPNAGLNFESIYWCNKLIEEFPNIKIDLFVPYAYRRLGEKAYFLHNNMEWTEIVKQLPKNNYRICLHGFYHSRIDGINPNSNNNEFEKLSKIETINLISKIDNKFKSIGLDYHKTFRPPGFHISEEACIALTEMNFVIAGNKKYFDMYKDKIKNMKYIYYNWDLIEPMQEKKTIISYGHTSNWNKNFFNEDKYKIVRDILYKEEYKFSFIGDL